MPRPCQPWRRFEEEPTATQDIVRDACTRGCDAAGGSTVGSCCSSGTSDSPASADGDKGPTDAVATVAAATTLQGLHQMDLQLAELCDELCGITKDYHESIVHCMHEVLRQPLKLRKGTGQRVKKGNTPNLLTQFSEAVRTMNGTEEPDVFGSAVPEMPFTIEKVHTEKEGSHDVGKMSGAFSSEGLEPARSRSKCAGNQHRAPKSTFRKSATEWSLESRAQAELAWTDELSDGAPKASVRRQSIFSELWPQQEVQHFNSIDPVGRLWRWLSKNQVIEKVLAVVVISNAAFVGAQVQYAASNPGEPTPAAFGIAQNAYFAFFSAELLLRVAVSRKAFFVSEDWGWNIFDASVVLGMFVESLGPLLLKNNQNSLRGLSVARLIRTVRAVGLIRHMRIVRILRPLRVLFHSILCTLSSLVWAMVLLALIMYTFSVTFVLAATDFVGAGLVKERDEAEILKYWGSVPRSSYTLFMAVSGGISWETVVGLLQSMHWCYGVIFVLYIILVVYAVLNLVNGVFCQSAIEGAEHGKDEIIAEQMRQSEQRKHHLRQLFHDINGWDSDVLTVQEFSSYLQDERVSSYFTALNLKIEDAYDFFRLLDTSDNDTVDVDEFVEAVLRLGGHARAIDIAIMMKEKYRRPVGHAVWVDHVRLDAEEDNQKTVGKLLRIMKHLEEKLGFLGQNQRDLQRALSSDAKPAKLMK